MIILEMKKNNEYFDPVFLINSRVMFSSINNKWDVKKMSRRTSFSSMFWTKLFWSRDSGSTSWTSKGSYGKRINGSRQM